MSCYKDKASVEAEGKEWKFSFAVLISNHPQIVASCPKVCSVKNALLLAGCHIFAGSGKQNMYKDHNRSCMVFGQGPVYAGNATTS